MYVLSVTVFEIITVNFPMYSIPIFDLELKVEDVDDLHENRLSDVPCQRVYVCENLRC